METSPQVFLASVNQQKFDGTRDGFRAGFCSDEIAIEPDEILPEGNAQAEGDEEIIRQALDRLNKLRAKLGERIRGSILVAIQNGIISVEVEGQTRWLDIAWVLLQGEDGKIYAGHSSGVEFDAQDVEGARNKEGGFMLNTAGAFRAKRLGGDIADPQLSATDGVVSRAETIQMTVEILLGQMFYDKGLEPKTLQKTESKEVAPDTSRPIFEGVVESTSVHKVGPFREAVEEVFCNLNTHVDGESSPSEINMQPYGNKETLEGALNRVNNSPSKKAGNIKDVRAGMESGILPVVIGEFERYFDSAWVVLEGKSGKKYLARSSGVEFDAKFVKRAKEIGFDKTTVGDVMAKEGEVSPTDPPSTLTNQLVSRGRTLKHVSRIALGQMRYDMRRAA